MASIQDTDVVDRFRAAMEKFQTKLQVRTAALTEAVLEQGRAHKQLLGSAVVLVSQNRANKDRLNNLQKAKQVFQEHLGLEIRKTHGEKLQFIFQNMDPASPDNVYTFMLRIQPDGSYQIISSDPPLKSLKALEKRLRETNNLSAFLANIRKEFVAQYRF